jgi:Zn-dependent protease with chaperone function
MALEPMVVEKIEEHRNRVWWNKTIIAVGLGAAILLAVALLVLAVVVAATSSRSTLFSNLKDFTMMLAEALIFILVLMVGIPWAIFAYTRRDRRYFHDFFTSSVDIAEYGSAIQRITDSLDGLSIAVDMKTPRVSVIDVAGLASATFHDGEGYGIAITKEALKTDLTDQELEGLLAHEAAHVLLGEAIECPRFWSLPGILVPLWLWIVGLAGIASYVAEMSHAANGSMVAAAVFTFWIVSFVIAASGVMFARRLKKLQVVDELRADSIAAKITSNPQAIRDALRKLQAADLCGGLRCDEVRLRREEGKLYLSLVEQDDQEMNVRQSNLAEIKKGRWMASTVS